MSVSIRDPSICKIYFITFVLARVGISLPILLFYPGMPLRLQLFFKIWSLFGVFEGCFASPDQLLPQQAPLIWHFSAQTFDTVAHRGKTCEVEFNPKP